MKGVQLAHTVVHIAERASRRQILLFGSILTRRLTDHRSAPDTDDQSQQPDIAASIPISISPWVAIDENLGC